MDKRVDELWFVMDVVGVEDSFVGVFNYFVY